MTEKQIEKEIERLRNELSVIQDRKAAEENAKLYRRCFKYRNSYSCPEPNEYWFLYLRVTGVEGREIRVTEFQTDHRGKKEYEQTSKWSGLNGYTEISEKEFSAAFKQFRKGIDEP